ncbi:MAG: FAD-binding protein [bacterium]|nr:FAD-binding protein [bacterium]
MEPLRPTNTDELAEALASASAANRGITLGGSFTKKRMAGPPVQADVTISTCAMRSVVEYEPRDLTISVEAGIPLSELNRITGEHGQMAPLDPPFSPGATAGGVVASNTSGPQRRLHGTVRDAVIGTKFITVVGKAVQSGGMVVKNAAGLDMAKLMAGSFGTLAALATVNFRLVPRPPLTRTFVSSYETLAEAAAARNTILRGFLQPAAIDLLNPAAAARVQRQGFTLLIQTGGNEAVVDRYSKELDEFVAIEGEDETSLWDSVREFTPRFLAEHASGAVVRLATPISTIPEAEVPLVTRAGSGVTYAYFTDGESAAAFLQQATANGHRAVLEFHPEEGPPPGEMWPNPGTDLVVMEKIKRMFDPHHLLNKGRLYGRL